MHFSGIVNLHAFLCLRVSCSMCECLHHLMCVIVHLCACVCALAWSSLVHHHPPCTAPWLQAPGRIWSHGLAQAWSFMDGCGKEGKPGRRPLHSSQKQKGQGSPSFHPSDLCVRCLPTHERLLEMLSPCLAKPKPEGPEARGQLPIS